MNSYTLSDKAIEDFIGKLKEGGLWLNTVSFKVNPHQKFIILKGTGASGFNLDNDYYENIRAHLEFANFSWLTSFYRNLNCNLETTISVSETGDFVSENDILSLSFNIQVDQRGTLKSLVYSKLRNFLLLKEFITHVTFKGTNSRFVALNVNLECDIKKINKLLSSDKPINKTILEQWVAAIDLIENSYKGSKHICCEVPVLNGRLEYKNRKDDIAIKVFINEA